MLRSLPRAALVELRVAPSLLVFVVEHRSRLKGEVTNLVSTTINNPFVDNCGAHVCAVFVPFSQENESLAEKVETTTKRLHQVKCMCRKSKLNLTY